MIDESSEKLFFICNEKIDKSTSNIKYRSLCIFQESDHFNILKYLPRIFTIKTRNNSSKFNIDLLKYTSSVIHDNFQHNTNIISYNLEIDDKRNVLSKFELMYQGEKVIFESEDLPTAKEITKYLNLTCCPNYLKPKELKNYYTQFKGHKKCGVIVNPQSLRKFLKNGNNNHFTIKTKKHEYKCNFFGIYYSDVIRKILIKNPKIDHFTYDIDDEFGEFQTICSLFDFNKIELTKDNINFLKETAKNLRISTIIERIDANIVEFEKESKIIDEQENLEDTIEDLFGWLYKIEQFKVEKVKDLIVESLWSKEKDNVSELAAFIIHVIKTNFSLQSKIIDLLILLQKEANETNYLKILTPLIIKKLMPIFGDKLNFCSFIYKMYKSGMITKEDLIDKLKKQAYKKPKININLISWFLPEIIESKIHSADNIVDAFIPKKEFAFPNQMKQVNKFEDWQNLIQYYLANKMDLYKKMRNNGEPDDELIRSLIHDDVDKLQSIVSHSKVDFSVKTVPLNILYDKLNGFKLSYINYAAMFGSIKCFKYLLLNHAKIDQNTFACAIKGGNIEIIKIVDQKNPYNLIRKNITFGKKIDNEVIIMTIKKHQNDLFDWIFENKYMNKIEFDQFAPSLLEASAKYGNAHSFVEIVNKKFNFLSQDYSIIKKSAINGFYHLLQLIMNLVGKLSLKKINVEYEWPNPFHGDEFVSFGNLEIFKLSLTFVKTTNYLEKALSFAVLDGYKDIIDYFFSDIINKVFKITKEGVFKAFNNSFYYKLFNYLFDKFTLNCPSIFINFKELTKILTKACSFKQIDAVKKLTEMILKNDLNENFNEQFLEAAINESIEICHYFIDKNVFIDFEELSSLTAELGTLNVDIFSLIVEKSDQEMKQQLFKTVLPSAIEKHNKKLVDYLLKNGSPIENSLFLAISCNDYDIVDTILNYNNKPSFINKISSKGTAIHMAIDKLNVNIVKRILKVPGINLLLYNNQGKSALSLAISRNSIKIVDAILDFFGEKISSEKKLLDEVAKETLNLISEVDENKYVKTNSLTPIYERIVKIKGIDLNFSGYKYTFLSYACKINEIEIVKMLLENDNIDVNIYSFSNGNTPLITAVNNKNIEIAELLIKDERTNINSKNYDNNTALTISVHKKLTKIIDLLIHNKKFDPDLSLLNLAFYESSGKIANQLSSCKLLDVNYQNFYDQKKEHKFETTLTYTVIKSDLMKIDLIINHPSFDKIKSQYKKAVFISIENNKIRCFKKLLKIPGFDINFSMNLESVLSLAVKFSSLQIVKLILKNPSFNSVKSNIYSSFLKGITILNDPSYKIIKRYGTRVGIEYEEEEDYDEFTQNKGDIMFEILNELIEFDKKNDNLIDIKKGFPNGKSLFCLNKNSPYLTKYINFLIDHGADPNEPDMNGVYPLEYAINTDNEEFVHALINSGKIDFNKKTIKKKITINEGKSTEKNETYLHLAAKSKKVKILQIFLDTKLFDINATDDSSETPLMKACRFCLKDNILLLFKYENLDYLHCNNDRKNALQILKDNSIYESNEIPKNKDEYLNCLLHLIDFEIDDDYELISEKLFYSDSYSD